MELFTGISYNIRGLWLGIRTPKLLFWGLIRFTVVIFITFVSSGLILAYHQDIMAMVWARPESHWILWAWYLLSWFLTFFLVALAAILSYLISQILFSVIIMDLMSRITEAMVTGHVKEPHKIPTLKLFFYLIKQEVPRATLPILLSLLLFVLGWLVPLGGILVFFSTGMAIIFLSWDNTDLTPARRLDPFKARFYRLLKTIPFHLGFGLLFLIPGLNILSLSFAPVGATLYFLEKNDDLVDTSNAHAALTSSFL
jgi:CysZ protein